VKETPVTESDRYLAKPLLGGVFGDGRYALATALTIEHGLHAVRYLVIEPRAGQVLAVGACKGDVLAGARRVIVAASELAANEETGPEQTKLWPDEELPTAVAAPMIPTVPRRRREIFERSGGRCWHCGCELQLAGPWDCDHQLPRALGGGNEPLNLVASCVRCNRSKGDRSALEFLASRRPT
jgi:hypothetical protein